MLAKSVTQNTLVLGFRTACCKKIFSYVFCLCLVFFSLFLTYASTKSCQLTNPEIVHCPIPLCRAGEVQEKVRLVQERLSRMEGELEEGMEERSEKYAELRSKEKMITGTLKLLPAVSASARCA